MSLSSLEQSGGGVMSVELDGNGEKFDALVYGERDKYQWVPGSEFFRRTQGFQRPS